MVDFSLFCVTIFGLESNLPTPFASAAVMNRSPAKFGDRCPKKKPLVGTPAPRLTLRGKPAVLVPDPEVGVPISGGCGMPVPVVTGLTPTLDGAPKIVRPLVVVPAKPHCTPMSCAKEREAELTRASISTC